MEQELKIYLRGKGEEYTQLKAKMKKESSLAKATTKTERTSELWSF